MPKPREKNRSLNLNSPKTPFPYAGEVLGVLFLFLTIFIGIALFSFSPFDPAFGSASSFSKTPIQNWAGRLGAYSADTLLYLFGLAAYPLVFLFGFLSFFFFRDSNHRSSAFRLPLLFFWLGMLGVFFQLRFPKFDLWGAPIAGGGLLGSMIAEPLRDYLNPFGAYLFVVFFGLLSLIVGSGVSVKKIFLFARRFVKACMIKFEQFATVQIGRVKEFYKQFQERQKARSIERESLKKKLEKAPLEKVAPRILSKKPALETSSNQCVLLDLENETENQGPQKPIEAHPNTQKTEAHLAGPSEPKIFERIDLSNPRDLKEGGQLSFAELLKGFVLPPTALLDAPEKADVEVDAESLKLNARLLEKKLLDFGVEGRVTEIHPGPVITMYEFEPASGVKVSKIVNLEDDLTLAMGGRSVRIVSHLQGKAAVGIEIPNHARETVYLREILADSKFQKAESKLTLALGKDIEGISFVSDLQKMPHLLVAGATGAGKSVCLNAIILSMLYKATPEDVRFLFVDPKMLELSIYQGIPHLLLPVVTDPKKAAVSLRWAVAEMERRYKLMSHAQVRNLAGYNKKIEKGQLKDQVVPSDSSAHESQALKHDQKLPFIVIIIDELADLMLVAGREVEEYITRLAQMARAAGIHLILATQRPSVDVITGIIKANFPARISFKVSSAHDSRTIIDTVGAEHLLGAGDMLFLPPGIARLLRVHGAFVSDTEVMRVVEHLKKQAEPIYDESILQFKETKTETAEDDLNDELYDQAVAIVTESRQASISMVQRRLRIGYNRAARMIEKMEAEGIVSAADGAKGREVLVSNFGEP